MKLFNFFVIIISHTILSQNINVNDDFSYRFIRNAILMNEIETDYSLDLRPLNVNNLDGFHNHNYKSIFKTKKGGIEIKSLGIDYFIEFNSNHPYNRNNGTMIPNKGYQHIISPGIYFKTGPLIIQFKPEHHFSENKIFDGFWEGHYPIIWRERYRLWNHIDMPERYGDAQHNRNTFGQSSIRLNWKNLSLGISNENIWWGPSLRNSIMMSNHAEGFKHITFNSNRPLKTFLGNFEWQFITGKLENSGFTPPRTDFEYAGTKLYVPKMNQKRETDDWRYLQGYIISFSPKIIKNLSISFIRWVQMYSALIEGRYTWMIGNPTYFPVFQNLFRRNDKYENYEAQTNQAAGITFNWLWKDSNARIYGEFHQNDSRQNFRDLILDSDHSSATTLGVEKLFRINNSNYILNWEWTRMEQTAGKLLRTSRSWYQHRWVFDGYTNKGEVLGSSIGPGSNSQFISIQRIHKKNTIELGFEIIDHDNDFYHFAFESAGDYRRYWKDLNLHLNFRKGFKNFNLSSNLIFIRSLNYQWELEDYDTPYYHAGKDVNNFHITFKLTYFGNW